MKKIFFFTILFITLVAGYCAFDGYVFLTTPGETPGKEVTFTIEPGSTFIRVAWDLKKIGALQDVKRFQIFGKIQDSITTIKAGDYLIDTSWTPPQLLAHITSGKTIKYRLSIREGLTWWETARAIEKQGFATYEDFIDIIHNPEFLHAHAIPFVNAEGFLYPDTYFLDKPKVLNKEQATYIASLLVQTFWKKTLPVWKYLPPTEPSDPSFGSAVAFIGKDIAPLASKDIRAFSYKTVFSVPLEEYPEATPAPSSPKNEKVIFPTQNHETNSSSIVNATNTAPITTATTTSTTEQVTKTENASLNSAINVTALSDQALATGAPEITDSSNLANATVPIISDTNGSSSNANATIATTTLDTSVSNNTTNASTVAIPEANKNSNNATASNETNSFATTSTSDSKAASSNISPVNSLSDNTTPTSAAAASSKNATTILNTTDSTPTPTIGSSPVLVTTPLTSPSQNDQNTWPIIQQKPSIYPVSPGHIDIKKLKEKIILASLVERETGLPIERPRVAGVYANRITIGMLLQCDPTIIYGIGPSFTGAILRSQLQDASNKYNTYIHAGLPPGPISSFGLDAFVAAIFPEKHKYLFFVATGLGKDHTFSTNIRDHNKAVQVYRARTR